MEADKNVIRFRNSWAWKRKKKKLIKGRGKKCEWCGSKKRLTPAHKHREFNKRKERFIDWYKNFDNCLLLCNVCHLNQGKDYSPRQSNSYITLIILCNFIYDRLDSEFQKSEVHTN